MTKNDEFFSDLSQNLTQLDSEKNQDFKPSIVRGQLFVNYIKQELNSDHILQAKHKTLANRQAEIKNTMQKFFSILQSNNFAVKGKISDGASKILNLDYKKAAIRQIDAIKSSQKKKSLKSKLF